MQRENYKSNKWSIFTSVTFFD